MLRDVDSKMGKNVCHSAHLLTEICLIINQYVIIFSVNFECFLWTIMSHHNNESGAYIKITNQIGVLQNKSKRSFTFHVTESMRFRQDHTKRVFFILRIIKQNLSLPFPSKNHEQILTFKVLRKLFNLALHQY